MKLNECLDIMEINSVEFIDHDVFTLKKQYHNLALKAHPDKGGSEVDFQKLNEAYTYLNEVKLATVEENSIRASDAFRYVELLMFLLNNEHLRSFVYGKCMSIVQKLLNDLKMKYYQSFKNKPEESKNQLIIELNPTLNDMIINNVYKYNYEDTYFLVPLWHGEVHFEYNGKAIIFLCHPIIPDNLYIDKYNVVHIVYKDSFQDVVKMKSVCIPFGDDILRIPVEKLRITDYQTHKFFKRGLSEINGYDTYDVSSKMDVLVHIYLNH
jgi:hypothetical protein